MIRWEVGRPQSLCVCGFTFYQLQGDEASVTLLAAPYSLIDTL